MPKIPAMQKVEVGGFRLRPTWGMAQGLQCLPHKHRALSSNPSTTKLPPLQKKKKTKLKQTTQSE
jgi:hypothetical protein